MIILYPILIFLSKTVNGKFSLLQMFPPPKFSSPSLVLHNLRFLTPNFFSPAFFSHPTSSFPKISPDFSSSKSFSSPKKHCLSFFKTAANKALSCCLISILTLNSEKTARVKRNVFFRQKGNVENIGKTFKINGGVFCYKPRVIRQHTDYRLG